MSHVARHLAGCTGDRCFCFALDVTERLERAGVLGPHEMLPCDAEARGYCTELMRSRTFPLSPPRRLHEAARAAAVWTDRLYWYRARCICQLPHCGIELAADFKAADPAGRLDVVASSGYDHCCALDHVNRTGGVFGLPPAVTIQGRWAG